MKYLYNPLFKAKPGATVMDTARDMISVRDLLGIPVLANFNDIELTARMTSTADSIDEQYTAGRKAVADYVTLQEERSK